ncbi:hypothetical protein K523DRAFT_377056 [Schizophyllum commune Tattone D]|nr:hypothetical protein K523DRAFT_377056 [Schizophyllum commune Tattone D]
MSKLTWKQWTQSPKDLKTYSRIASNVELFEYCVAAMNNGDFTMHACLQLSLEKDVAPNDFLASARKAWLALRYQIPPLAATISKGPDTDITMTYRVPTAEEADDWARETVNIYEGADGSLEDARFQVSSRPNPAEGSGLGCFVHVVPGASQREYGLVIVVNHSLFDGTGGKIVSGRFLTHLAEVLRAEGRAPEIAWGKETENLLPGYEEVMADAEADSNEKARKGTLDAVLGEIVRLAERAHTVRYAASYVPPDKPKRTRTRVASRVVDQETSACILTACKARGFTPNHVANAALSIVLARNNPPTPSTPDTASHVYWLAINCRDRLRPPYNGDAVYPFFAMNMYPLAIPVKDAYLPESAPKDEVKKRLLALTEQVKPTYVYGKTLPALLAIEQELMGMLIGPVLAAGTMPPQTNPLFMADGDANKQIPITCPGAFTVSRYMMSVNKRDGAPICRLQTFGGKLIFNLDYNPDAIPRDVAEEWTQAWADTTALIAQRPCVHVCEAVYVRMSMLSALSLFLPSPLLTTMALLTAATMAAPSLPELLSSNRAPTDNERQSTLALIQSWRREEAALEAEVSALQAALTQKFAKLEDVRGRIHLHRGALSSLRSLPLEVLQHIFRFTLPTAHNALLSPDEPPILLTRVCRAWREVALSTPELWASFHVVCTPFDTDMSEQARQVVELRLRAVETWLARSGTWPLDISIHAEYLPVSGNASTVTSVLRTVLSHSRRWRDLAVVATMEEMAELLPLRLDLPQLRSFAFCELGQSVHPDTVERSQPLFLSGARNLQHVTLLYRRSDQLKALRVLPLQNMVSLHLCARYSIVALHDGLQHLVGACVHLQHLRLKLISSGREDFVGPEVAQTTYRGSPTVLPDLATLDLSCYPAIAKALFDRVSAPSLSSLSLSLIGCVFRDGPESTALARFLRRSGVPVRKLCITTYEEDILHECLPYLPHLEELVINRRANGWTPGLSALEPLLHEGHAMACPYLQLAEFDRCDVDLQWLLQFLQARASNLDHGPPVLRSVKAYFSTPPSDNVEELVAPFRLAGVHVEMHWNERKQERQYHPRIGVDWEAVVEEMSGDVNEWDTGGAWGI